MNSISHFYTNMLKKRIKNEILGITDEIIEVILNSLTCSNNYNKYVSLLSNIEEKVYKLITKIIKKTFEDIDYTYSNSLERKRKYVINKSNVKRTITTIFGEITFKRTYFESKLDKSKHFFIDEVFGLPKYDHYDPIVKGLTIDMVFSSNQSLAGKNIGERISNIKNIASNRVSHHIPRQSVYNWIKNWNVPNTVYEQKETPYILYVMADEKFIGCQDLEGDIMAKCMVAFENTKHVSKNRNMLVNKTVFTTYGNNPWGQFLDVLNQKYDLEKIKEIKLLGDGANWINSGIKELKTNPKTSITKLLCEFHFKQSINRITTDEENRKILLETFNKKTKKEFENKVLELTKDISEKKRKDSIDKNLNYILNNYKAIKDMLKSPIGSSMESHISHYIANLFSSRPKGFSSLNIKKYLKLNDYKINGFNLFDLYLKSYDNDEVVTLDQSELNYSIFEKNTGIPILKNGEITNTYKIIHSLVY